MKTYGFSTSSTTNTTNPKTTSTTTKQITTSTAKEGFADQDGFRDELGSVPTMGDNLVHVSVYFNTLNERKVETVEVYDVSFQRDNCIFYLFPPDN